jgi:hypothetical protein
MTKIMSCLGLGILLGFAMMGAGCAPGSHPVIIIHNGYYGYYDGALWCDWTNDYCGTGVSYGIGDNGCYYNGYYCSGGYSTGVGSGGYSTGVGSTGTGSTGTGSTGGIVSTGTGSTGTGSTGATSGGYTTGSTGGSTGSGSSGSSGYSMNGGTKDVDLQRAALQQQDLDNRATQLAAQYQMNFESARQLTQLADQMQKLSAQGQMTDNDRDALARSALGVAGVSPADVQAAIVRATKNQDKTALQQLMDKAASNLGMSSSAALRDEILPSLGLTVN